MLAIRLNRVGKNKRSQFRIAVQEHTIAPGGRHVEIVGSWDPHLKKGVFKAERVKYWLEKGAQASDTVHNLLIKQGVIKGKKRAIKVKKAAVALEEKPTEAVGTSPTEAPKEEVKK